MKVGVDYTGITTAFYCTDGAGRFLFNKRSKQSRDEQGTWDCGAGKLEFGLSLEENVLKEVREEYGCVGEILEQLPAHAVVREHAGERTHWVAIPFVVRVDPAEVKNNEPHKFDVVEWFTLDNLPTPLHSVVAKEIELYGPLLQKFS